MDTHDIEEQIMLFEKEKYGDLSSTSAIFGEDCHYKCPHPISNPLVFNISGRLECLFELQEKMNESLNWLNKLRKHDENANKEYIESVLRLSIKRKELIDEYYKQIFKTVKDKCEELNVWI